jgi:hypothetical protein
LIGVGVLAVVGVGGFLWYRSRQNAADTSEGGDTRSIPASEGGSTASAPAPELEPELPLDETLSPTTPLTPKEARQGRKQSRRDCRAEAIQRRLKGKEKRQFKRECKAAGGINADFVGEEANFAFNGYSCFN